MLHLFTRLNDAPIINVMDQKITRFFIISFTIHSPIRPWERKKILVDWYRVQREKKMTGISPKSMILHFKKNL